VIGFNEAESANQMDSFTESETRFTVSPKLMEYPLGMAGVKAGMSPLPGGR